jgi:phage gp36-like protein
MAYATLSDIETIYSPSVLDRIAYNPDLETPGRDAAMVARACDEATAEIDTHLSVTYSVPINPTPPILRQLAVDIAIYRMALTFDKMTVEITERYKSATKMLERIADGKAGLGIRREDVVEGETPENGGDVTSFSMERA